MVIPAHDILGVGNPFIDHILEIDDQFLQHVPGTKGGMVPVDYNTLTEIISKSGKEPILLLGGSGANTIRGLAHLGYRCALIGKIGQDAAGEKFLARLKDLGVRSFLVSSETPTAQAVCLITPDMERTMRSFLGASQEMSPGHLDQAAFEGAKLVHIEGYSLMNESLTEEAMKLAKKAGAKISFDLGSFEVVHLHRETIIRLLGQYVDIVFANQMETHALTKLAPQEGAKMLSQLVEVAVILQGKEGCLVGRNSEFTPCPALTVEALDTTGAGDLFASGFLHGYLKGLSLEECARFGALTGAAVVQVRGVEIPEEKWKTIKQEMGE